MTAELTHKHQRKLQEILDAQRYIVVTASAPCDIGEVIEYFALEDGQACRLSLVVVGLATKEEFAQQKQRFSLWGVLNHEHFYRVIAE
jgi:hypothetical protein